MPRSPKKRRSENENLEVPKRLKTTEAKRTRKTVVLFTTTKTQNEEKEFVIPKGKGKKLQDIPTVWIRITNRPKSSEILQKVHTLLLGKANKKTDVKGNLGLFNGIVYDEKGREKFEARVQTKKLKDLREINSFFGQQKSGDKDDLTKRLVDFLEKPKASEHDTEESPKRQTKSRSPSKKAKTTPTKKKTAEKKSRKEKKKKDPNAPKRPKSGYILFSIDARPALVKKYPAEKLTEISKRLGKEWKKKGPAEKKKYEAQAAKEKERYLKEMKKYKKPE